MAAPPVCPASCGLRLGAAVAFWPRCDALPPPPAWHPPPAPPSDQPDPKSQRNFTDPESRIMKSKDGFVQAYNAQAAVDAGAQIIVAHELTQCGNDQGQLVPLIEAIENNLGRKPEQASADSGYCSEANLEALEAHGVDGYVAPGRAKHPTAANGKIG